MKRNFLLISFLALLSIPSFIFGQGDTNWVQLMSDPTANFYDVQAAFQNYWKDRPIQKGKGYKQFKRWEDYMAPRVYPSGDMTLPSLAYPNYLEWLNQVPVNPEPSALLGNWSSLGPIGVSNGGGAGRINFVRFDPTNSAIVYVGAPDGGLWKTTNGGTTWTTNTDQLTVIGCTDVAIDPTNTQVMYLATGDGEAGDSYSVGVLKSTDGGATWNTTGLNWTVNQGRLISRLLMHPTNSQILIAATSNGMYRTVDGGTTWTQTSTGNFKDAEFNPSTPNTVYAAGSIYRRSTDNGVTWTTISTGLPTTGIERISIAVTPANAAYVYLLIGRSSDQGLLGIYRSTDNGGTFTLRKGPTGPNLLGWESNGSDAGGQAFYDLAIAASPTNAEYVLVGGVNSWKSSDGGTTWTLNTHWTGSGAPYVHADVHAIEFLPGSGTTYFMGHDGGISKTTNTGTSFTDISGNMAIAQQYRIGLSATTAGRMVTGHQDNGTNMLNAGVWNQIYGGDGMDCFIDRTNNNTIYGSYVYGDYYKSTNGGASWTTITTGLPGGDWLCAWHQDPITAATLYAGGRSAMYRSTNGGTNWSALGTPSGSGSILEFAIAPSNNQIIYSVKQNAVSKSTDGGTTWTNITGTIPTGSASVTNVTVSNTDPNVAFVTLSGYSSANKVFKTINGGTSWTNVSTGLPNVPCNTIVYQNGAANDLVYVGTDVGVFYKDNTMASWVSYMTGLPRVAVRDLEIFYTTGKIRAATFGRGAWESDLASLGANPPVAEFTASQTTICAGGTVTFTDQSAFAPTSWAWTFTGGTPATSTAQNPTITYSTAGTYNVTLTATNANGNNSITKSAYIVVLPSNGVALPLTEGFVATTMPPTGWSIVNGNASTTWAHTTAAGLAPTAGNSIMFDNYNVNDGDDDEFRIKALTLTSLSAAQLSFDVAYAPYDASNFDGLEVLVSTNCGVSFTSVFSKSNTVLATAPANTNQFTPTAAQWRNEVISLTPYVGQSNVIIAFRNLSGYGNRLFVDNINITGTGAATASFTPSSTSVCQSQNVTFTDASSGATSWSWNFGAGATPATATGAGPHTVSYSTSGSKTVTLTINGSTSSNQVITVNALPSTPTISAGGSTTFCAGGSVNLTSSAGTSYLWSTGATTQTISATTAGTYTVQVTNASGCQSSASSATTVTVNALPSTPTISAGGSTTFCAGGSVNLTSSTGTSYLWSTGATTQTISATTAGTYTVQVTNAAGCQSSASSGTTVTVNALPSTPTISAGGPTTFCAGGSVVLTSSAGSGNTWSTGATSNSITVTTAGTYTVNTNNGSCTSANSSGITVSVTPSVTPTISVVSNDADNTICSGTSVTFTATPTNGGATPVYQWQVNGTNAGTNSPTFNTSGLTNGQTVVCILNSNANCASPTTANSSGITMTVNSAPAIPGTITGNTSICSSSTGNVYSISAVPGATSYAWTVPAGATITSGQGTTSITVDFGTSSGNVTVNATNSCGTSSNQSQAITVNSSLPTPTITASGSTTICSGNSVVLTSSAATGNTWSNGATTPSITVTTPGTYSVIVNNGSCVSPSSAGTTVTVNPLPATPTISASGPITFCEGGSVNLTASSSTGNTWSSGQTTQTISVTTSGVFTVTTSDGTCTSLASSPITVTANPKPVVTFGSLTDVCNTDAAFVLTQGSPAGGVYSGSGVSAGTFDPSQATIGAVNLTYDFTDGNGCSSSASTVVNVNDCSSLSELEEMGIDMYPNPTQGIITINSKEDLRSITCYDENGKVVIEKNQINSKNASMDLTSFANGTYSVELVFSNGKTIKTKVILVNK